jgi:sulfide dehydrogenase [flavocytochrome c] flavoprotein subunit
LVSAAELLPKKGKRVVVVGGGFAGTIAAKSLRMADPTLEVVLIERNRTYTALPGSNWFLGGSRRIGENRLSYDILEGKYGVQMLYGEASSIDLGEQRVVLDSGTLAYDFVIAAPGVGFVADDIEGYTADTPNLFPHAWGAGEEVIALRKRLEEMKNGGVLVVSMPAQPFRCPQAAYERVSQIAHYFGQAKPQSKIILLDAAPKSPVAALFLDAWARLYKGMIEYSPASPVQRIDTAKSTVSTPGGQVRGDVINLIPPQTAGVLAHKSGLLGTEKNWCPVEHSTGESTVKPGVYVIGDAAFSGNMEKSASAANAQGKACAYAILANLGRRKIAPPIISNVIYSLVNEREGAANVSFYRAEGKQPELLDRGGGLSPEWSELEGIYARAWLGSILAESSS